MEKFKKIDREFLLTDSTVNVYGFRLLTSGYLIDEYKKNPIGYRMHIREDGVIVRWEDLRVEGDSVYGKPVINMSNECGQQTVDEIENMFLNGASVGHLVILEYSDDPADKLSGQSGPTVTKWFNRECSVVDIPGNMNGLALYDEFDNPIQLADFTKTKFPNMKQIFFTGAQLAAMNLKADASEIEIASAFTDLVAKAAKSDEHKTQLSNLQSEVNKSKISELLSPALAAKKITAVLSDKLAKDYANNPEGLKSLLEAIPGGEDGKVDEMINTALSAKKITKELGDKLKSDYANNPEGLKNLLDAMPAYQSLESKLKAEVNGLTDELLAKSWDELFEAGLTSELKAKHPDVYKQKFKEAHGIEPTNI